jgi:hypothetical protein
MNKLELVNFKAFEVLSLTSLEDNNTLIYGENGSGKSSIFEGIKLFYFKERLFREQISANVIGVDRENEKERIINEYKNKEDTMMIVKIDDEDFKIHDTSSDNIFLVSYENINNIDNICIEDIINNAYFTNINNRFPWISKELVDLLVEETNYVLKEEFWFEDVILYSMDTKGNCSLKNANNKNQKIVNLSHYFNEALLHVINFIIIVESICYFEKKT